MLLGDKRNILVKQYIFMNFTKHFLISVFLWHEIFFSRHLFSHPTVQTNLNAKTLNQILTRYLVAAKQLKTTPTTQPSIALPEISCSIINAAARYCKFQFDYCYWVWIAFAFIVNYVCFLSIFFLSDFVYFSHPFCRWLLSKFRCGYSPGCTALKHPHNWIILSNKLNVLVYSVLP